MRTLIVGCGYVGMALGRRLIELGHEVFGLRRSAEHAGEMAAAGMQPLIADICDPQSLEQLPGGFDWVANTVSSSRGTVEAYRSVFLEGTRNLIDWLGEAPPKRFVFTGSTSVYGQTDGSAVKESSPAEPATETGRILVEAERLLLEAARERKFPAVILRVSGIYGPDRGHLFQQFRKGEAHLHGKGDRILNMIHQDDVAGAIIAALKNGRSGEIYNATDDEPVTELHFYHWLAEALGLPMPHVTPEAHVTEGRRGRTHKRVSNRRLKMELGYQFKHPTFRQGYTVEMTRLDALGLL